jgi:glutathione S-transferase
MSRGSIAAAGDVLENLHRLRQLAYRTEAAPSDPRQRQANEEAGARTEDALRSHFSALDRELDGHDFFCGVLSVADIAMFMSVLWTQRLKGPALTAYPALHSWYQRVGARPPFAKAAAEIAAADRALTPALWNR